MLQFIWSVYLLIIALLISINRHLPDVPPTANVKHHAANPGHVIKLWWLAKQVGSHGKANASGKVIEIEIVSGLVLQFSLKDSRNSCM